MHVPPCETKPGLHTHVWVAASHFEFAPQATVQTAAAPPLPALPAPDTPLFAPLAPPKFAPPLLASPSALAPLTPKPTAPEALLLPPALGPPACALLPAMPALPAASDDPALGFPSPS